MAEKSFPLENTQYTAADAQLWFATRTSGVYANDHFSVSASGQMNVTMKRGIAWLHYDEFGGCVYANTDNLVLPLEMSDASYDRIDRLCIRLEMLNNRCYAYIKKGTPASSPKAPNLQRDNVAYEISIARIRVGVGVTAINAGNITDERLNSSVCGLMRDGVTGIDTSVMEAQFNSVIGNLEAELQAVYDNVEPANVTRFKRTLYANDWTQGDEYKQTVEANGMLGADEPEVDVDLSGAATKKERLALDEAWSSNILCATTIANAVVVEFKELPEVNIPIKIKVVR